MIKWLIIYALYEKIKRDNGMQDMKFSIETITEALRALDPVQVANDCIRTFNSILSEPGVKDFCDTLLDFGVKFFKTIFQYYNG